MEFSDVVRRRRMVRNFGARPVPATTLDHILEAARRAPSAGNTQGWAFVVLETKTQTAAFWDITLPAERRGSFRWQGLLEAPVIVIPLAHRQAYLDRYSEADKAASGLGDVEQWPVPYWQVDTAFATMTLLLAATDAGLGALFFGLFNGEKRLMEALGVPPSHRPIGAVALGYSAPDEPGRSAARPRRPSGDVVHRGRWASP